MSSSAHLNIAVIGAGVIGTITAYKLQREKHNVTIYDSNEPGSVTSYGNAGTFANYACIPINNENIVKQLPSLIFGSNSPLSIQW